MTREEAINICKREQYCASHSACSHEECPWHDNCPDDAPFDSEIQEALDMAIEALNQTQWIPCEERLPDVNADILYCDVNGNNPTISMGLYTLDGETADAAKLETICECSGLPHPMTFIADPASISSKQWKGLRELVHHNRIIAWMPLPERYKEGKR